MSRTTSVELQRELSREVERAVGRDAIKAWHFASATRTLWTLTHVWGAIVAGFWAAGQLAALPLGIAIPLGLGLALFMATRINALNVLVHEGSHYCLAPKRWLNSALTNLVAGYFILLDEDGYRLVHNRHHFYLNESKDPDLPLYTLSRRRADILRQLIEDLFWISLFKRALVYRKEGVFKEARPIHGVGKVCANALLLVGLVGLEGPLAGPLLYVLFWVVPLFSFYPMIIRLRVITEHFAPEILTEDGSPPEVFVARTSECGFIEGYLLGAQMEFHFEHHLFPGIPYHHCRAMHANLTRAGFFDQQSARRLSGGYFAFWRRLIKSPFFTDTEDAASAT